MPPLYRSGRSQNTNEKIKLPLKKLRTDDSPSFRKISGSAGNDFVGSELEDNKVSPFFA